MKRKEIKNWVNQAIKRGYDKKDVNELLIIQHEKGEINEEDIKKVLEVYDEQFIEVERSKLSFFQRRALKKGIKKTKLLIEESAKEFNKLNSKAKALNKKEKEKLEKLKYQMIEAIIGNIEKNTVGLNSIFDIDDEKTGETVTKEILEDYTIDELEELLTDLLESLEKEI